ncbi:MAG: polysaccharide biosynthesis C-terminal domain-containing protein [Lachnospiraceae bacterium]|nr:polysaccharide biosynthesis C-terminal domain-containing protein [Lachnospiraceae bacterium]
MKENKESVFKSFLEYFYGNFIVLLLGLISTPLITRVMTEAEYGRSAMFQSVVSVVYIFAILGLDQGYIRFFYQENINRKKLFYQCLYPALTLILIMSFIYYMFAGVFNSFLFERNSIDVTLLVVGYAITSIFERFLFLNIRMDRNGKLYSNLNILSKVLYISFILIFVRILGDDFRVVLYALTLPLVIVTFSLFVRFIIIGRGEKISLTKKGPGDVTERELLKYSVPFIPMLLMEWLLSSMDKWSIRIFNDFSETGVYAAAMQIIVLILTIKITFVAFWSPIAMEKYEKESEEVCKSFFVDMFSKVQFLCVSLAYLLTTFRGVVVLLLGERFRGAIKLIPFLALMPVLSILFEMTGQGVKFVKKVKYLNYASFAAICCNLLGNTLLVPKYKGIGAALATAITYIVYFAIGTYLADKFYPVKYRLKSFIASLILYSGYAAFAVVTEDQLMSFFVGIIVTIIHCIINIDVVKALLETAIDIVKKMRNKS